MKIGQSISHNSIHLVSSVTSIVSRRAPASEQTLTTYKAEPLKTDALQINEVHRDLICYDCQYAHRDPGGTYNPGRVRILCKSVHIRYFWDNRLVNLHLMSGPFMACISQAGATNARRKFFNMT